MDPKEKLIKEFQRNPDRYWKVKLFDDLGFDRKKCTNCGKFFWTCTKQIVCNDSSCRNYDFIGNPPTKSKFDYFETWNLIRKFFGKNDHAWINRYPVICRWLPDLNFVIAGIVDFMRVENGNSLFSLPANPLILLQPCLRFNDIINTGINGRSYTEFEMIQQTSSFDGKNGYWKDRCMELDYEMLTKVFGIPKQEIVFIEDVWVGPKAFGSSLEYHVQGLELGNAVFTEFEGTIESHRQMRNKIIDMGAGLNRFAWISNGTPTSYDVVFGDVTDKIKNKVGFSGNKDFFAKYSKLSGKINFGESNFEREREKVASDLKISLDQLEKNILPYQALYSIADHTRSLVFAISDSGIPSNVGGGHNLRVILRRALAFIERFKWDLNLEEVANWHIDYLKKMFPDLDEKRDEISKILKVEESRYNSTKARASKIVEALTKQKIKPTYDELKTFYQSEGITPDQLISAGLEIKVPAEFYQKITEREGQHKKVEQNQEIDVRGLPETKKLYYQKPWIFKFTAKVIKVIDGNLVVLDQTAFYPTGGGQVHDKGTIDGSEVLEVQKIGNIIVHRVDKPVSGVVECAIDKLRREKVSKHHTATHIINAAARKVLGFHVWQNSAFKDENEAHLDITHFEALNEQEVERIENFANDVVKKNIPIKIAEYPREEAEKKFGFRIYQGGDIPEKNLRIIEIPGVDVEACGGTHRSSTGEVGFILILKTKRIQDGAVRIRFASGEVALGYLKEKEKILNEVSKLLNTRPENVDSAVEKLFETWKRKKKEVKKWVR